MSNPLIHRARRVPLREVFAHEALHFTTWLEDNIEALAGELGLQMSVIARDHVFDSYRLDLLCQDSEGHTIVIENQLESANLQHLGQIMMYLVSMEAKTAMWVVADAAPEYSKVVTWLNEATPADSFRSVPGYEMPLNSPDFSYLLVPRYRYAQGQVIEYAGELAGTSRIDDEKWYGSGLTIHYHDRVPEGAVEELVELMRRRKSEGPEDGGPKV